MTSRAKGRRVSRLVWRVVTSGNSQWHVTRTTGICCQLSQSLVFLKHQEFSNDRQFRHSNVTIVDHRLRGADRTIGIGPWRHMWMAPSVQSLFASSNSENRKKDQAARVLLRGKRWVQEFAPEDAIRQQYFFFIFQALLRESKAPIVSLSRVAEAQWNKKEKKKTDDFHFWTLYWKSGARVVLTHR